MSKGNASVRSARPFGSLATARLLVVGHDPRLQNSQAEADTAFFFDYLARPPSNQGSERAKRELAQATWDYVSHLAGRPVPLERLWVTNLCNEFLERPGRGTVLIPRPAAERGLKQIEAALRAGRFQALVSLSQQVFYWLCELGFIDEQGDERLVRYRQEARPADRQAALGLYVAVGARRAPFLAVCGQTFSHQGLPVIPVVHIKMWPLKPRARRYEDPMALAAANVRAALAGADL